MQKHLISIVVCASLLLSACSSTYVPTPNLVYKVDIQQGNVITQDMVNQLKPGMKRDQVRYILGTPPIADAFHAGRWDYLYTFNKGGSDITERRRVSLYFNEDILTRLEGDFRPIDDAGNVLKKKESAVDVPEGSREEKGFIMRLWDAISSDDEDEAFNPGTEGGGGGGGHGH